MTTSPSNRAYLTTMKDGSIVAICDDAAICVFSLETGEDMAISTLVEKRNGQRKVLVDTDAVLAEAMFSALRKSLLDNRHPASVPTKDAPYSLHRGISPVLLLLGIAGGMLGLSFMLDGMRPNDALPRIEASVPTINAPVNLPPAPAAASVAAPMPMAPDTRTVEEINAAKGAQPTPDSTDAPQQPLLDLPTNLLVGGPAEPLDQPVAELSSPTETKPEPAVVSPETAVIPLAPAPIIEAPASNIAPPPVPRPEGLPAPEEVSTAIEGDQSSANSPFGQRVEETQAALLDDIEQANATLAESGPEVATVQLDNMRKAVDMLQSGQKLSAEFVAQLPPDVAATLRDKGVVLTPEEAAAAANATGATENQIAIVRIPAPVLDARRNADGIADIPEANSWSNFGLGVNLPLPGGGEVRSPADMERFGMYL